VYGVLSTLKGPQASSAVTEDGEVFIRMLFYRNRQVGVAFMNAGVLRFQEPSNWDEKAFLLGLYFMSRGRCSNRAAIAQLCVEICPSAKLQTTLLFSSFQAKICSQVRS